MQQNAGLWAGLVLLGALAALFGVMSFNANNEIQRLNSSLVNASTDTLASSYRNPSVIALMQVNNQITEENRRLNQANADKDREILRARGEAEAEVNNAKLLQNNIQSLRNDLRTQTTSYDALRREHDGLRSNFDAEKIKEIATLRSWHATALADAARLEREGTAMASEIEAKNTMLRTLSRTHETQLNTLRQQIARFSNVGTQGAANTVAEKEFDGEVLETNIPAHTVIVNVGKLNHARAGMRFEVRRQKGTGWAPIAEIELTRVGETHSEALIVGNNVPTKICPTRFGGCGEKTTDMYMRYCPYCRKKDEDTRKETNEVIELEVVVHEEISTMDPMNPVLKGDKIFNPMFDPDHRTRFVFVGDPILYTTEQLKAMIRNYNGEWQEEIRPDIDYVILGRFTENTEGLSEEAKKRVDRYNSMLEEAKIYGIRFLREAELRSFL